MNKLATLWLVIALSSGLAGCATKQAGKTAPVARSTAPMNKVVEWPQVQGFRRDEVHRYDDPRLGYSVAYRSDSGLVATVYLFDDGVAGIEDGASEAARGELEKATEDIRAAQRQGKYKSVQGGETRKTQFGSGPQALEMWAASFRVGREEGEALSDLYVAGRRGEFVKIRCTYLVENKTECERDRARLFDALAAALGG